MESVSFTPPTHIPGCSKCGRPCKGHPLPYGTNCTLPLAKEHADKSREIPAHGMEGPVAPPLWGLLALGQPTIVDNAAQVLAEQCPKPLDKTTPEKTTSLMTTMTTVTTRGSIDCSIAVLSTRLGQQEKQLARDRCQIDEPYQFSQWHCPSRASIISPATKHCFGQGQSLHQHFPHQWAGSPTQPCRVSTIHLGSTGTSTVFLGPGPQQHLKPLHQTFPSLGLSNQVSIESGCSCPGPSSSPKSATTPTGYSCHWTAWGHPAQHHGWQLLNQIGTGYPSGQGISAIQLTDSYQCTQHGNRYSYHGQGDPQCTSETTAENYTG